MSVTSPAATGDTSLDARFAVLWERADALRGSLTAKLMPWVFEAAPLFIAAGLERVNAAADERWPYVAAWELPLVEPDERARVGLCVSPVQADLPRDDMLTLEWHIWTGQRNDLNGRIDYSDLIGLSLLDSFQADEPPDLWTLAELMLQVEPRSVLRWCAQELETARRLHRIPSL